MARRSRKEEFALERAIFLAEGLASGPIDFTTFPEERVLIAQAAVETLKARLKQSGRPTEFAHLVLGEEVQDWVDTGMSVRAARKHVLARHPEATYPQIKAQHLRLRILYNRYKPGEVCSGLPE